MKKITLDERQIAADYETAKSKPLGNLHQRMKHAIEVLNKFRKGNELEFDTKFPGLSSAIYDLKTEVKFYRPEKPPLASRPS